MPKSEKVEDKKDRLHCLILFDATWRLRSGRLDEIGSRQVFYRTEALLYIGGIGFRAKWQIIPKTLIWPIDFCLNVILCGVYLKQSSSVQAAQKSLQGGRGDSAVRRVGICIQRFINRSWFESTSNWQRPCDFLSAITSASDLRLSLLSSKVTL